MRRRDSLTAFAPAGALSFVLIGTILNVQEALTANQGLADGAAPPVAGPAAKSALGEIIHNFARSAFRTEELIRLLAPSAVELKNRGVPPDQVYYMIQEKVVILRTRDPKLGILWWIKPPDGQ